MDEPQPDVKGAQVNGVFGEHLKKASPERRIMNGLALSPPASEGHQFESVRI